MARKTQRNRMKKATRSRTSARIVRLDTLIQLISQQKWPEVVQHAQMLLTTTSLERGQHILVLRFLAMAYMKLHEEEHAYETFTKILSLVPDDLEALFDRAVTGAVYTGRVGQAVRDLEAAAEHLTEETDVRLARVVRKELKRKRDHMQETTINMSLQLFP